MSPFLFASGGTAMEKRKAKRHGRRLRVRFGGRGDEGFPHNGFTHDISASGMFVVTGHGVRPGERVHCEVSLPSGAPLFLEGLVARQVIVPPELRAVVRSGFGLRFLLGNEVLGELVPSQAASLAPQEDPFCLAFHSAPEWRALFEQDLRRGGAYVWTDEPVENNSLVTVTFDLRFIKRQLSCEGRVVRAEPWPDGRTRHAVAFVDPVATVAALQQTFVNADEPLGRVEAHA